MRGHATHRQGVRDAMPMVLFTTTSLCKSCTYERDGENDPPNDGAEAAGKGEVTSTSSSFVSCFPTDFVVLAVEARSVRVLLQRPALLPVHVEFS